MNENQPVADKIHQKMEALGLSGFGAALIEGLAPLAPLGAQLAYILQPMFSSGVTDGLADLAGWLEEPTEVEALADRLRQDQS